MKVVILTVLFMFSFTIAFAGLQNSMDTHTSAKKSKSSEKSIWTAHDDGDDWE